MPLITPLTKTAAVPRGTHPPLTRKRMFFTSVSHNRLASTQPLLNAGAKNRRYAPVLSRLNKQPSTSSSSSSSTFTGYVPKCKQNNVGQCFDKKATTSTVSGTDEQRKSKVSFCLQTDQVDTLRGNKTTASASTRAVPVSRSVAASVTPVIASCNEAVMSSTTNSVQPLTTISSSKRNVTDIPCVAMPADSSDISMLCVELFVATNASFCDQLLESCPLPNEQPETPIPVLGDDSSINSKQDIPEPITDFALDDFVEFDFF